MIPHSPRWQRGVLSSYTMPAGGGKRKGSACFFCPLLYCLFSCKTASCKAGCRSQKRKSMNLPRMPIPLQYAPYPQRCALLLRMPDQRIFRFLTRLTFRMSTGGGLVCFHRTPPMPESVGIKRTAYAMPIDEDSG